MALFTPHERIAVFRGGSLPTSRQSMAHGAVVLDVLDRSTRYQPVDVTITAGGEWLHEGRTVTPQTFLAHIDGAYVAVLGQYGEDGQLARALEQHGVRHQTASPYAALTTWQKDLAATQAKAVGVRTPRRLVVKQSQHSDLHALSAQVSDVLGTTFVVKPLTGTQRTAVHMCASPHSLPAAVERVLENHAACLIEEFIDGQAVTVATAPGLRGQSLYHSPVMRWTHRFDDNGLLENDETLQPASLTRDQKQTVTDAVAQVYKALGLRGAVRTDLQITPHGEVYFLECNTIATLTDTSAQTQALAAVGVAPDEFISAQLTAR